MNRRIKHVWTISIVAMTAIFAMQAYWLYNQYEYSSTVKAEELKQACTKALEEEKDIRIDKQEDGKDDSSYVRMQIVLKIDQSTKKTKEKSTRITSRYSSISQTIIRANKRWRSNFNENDDVYDDVDDGIVCFYK